MSTSVTSSKDIEACSNNVIIQLWNHYKKPSVELFTYMYDLLDFAKVSKFDKICNKRICDKLQVLKNAKYEN